MPFNNLILSTLLDGETTYEENGIGVSIQRKVGESILFFEVDDSNNPCSNIKSQYGITNICDVIIFYSKGNSKKQRERKKPVLCFLELKGSDVKHALKQTINTCECLKRCIGTKVEYKILIVSKQGSSLSATKDANLRSKLIACVGNTTKNYHSKTGVKGKIDIRPYLQNNN